MTISNISRRVPAQSGLSAGGKSALTCVSSAGNGTTQTTIFLHQCFFQGDLLHGKYCVAKHLLNNLDYHTPKILYRYTFTK